MSDVMLDLETWGTLPGCAIRSIGAVLFDRLGGVPTSSFYSNVSLESCKLAGLRMEAATVAWWNKQSRVAQDALADRQLDLLRAAEKFHEWFRATGAKYVWCHGATFDVPVWDAACAAVGLESPWKFYDVRCTRTLYDLMDFDPKLRVRDGVHHNALDDARWQAYCVQEAISSRRGS